MVTKMIYENITYNEQWIKIVNICWSVLLIFLLLFSFIRTYFSCKKLSKTYCLITHIHKGKYNFQNKLFVSSVISELMTYVYFCLIFEFFYSDYPTISIVNGLSIVVWDYNTRFEGIIKLIIGIVIWVVLCVVFTVIFLWKSRNNITKKNLIKIGLLSSLRNFPFYFVFQFLLVFFMWLRVRELHVLQQFSY